MEQITISDSTQLVDPKLRAIVKHVMLKLELAIEKVAANHQDPTKYPLAADPTSFEQIIAARFRILSEEKKQIAMIKIMRRIKASKEKRVAHYGDLSEVDLTKAESIESQAKAILFPQHLKFSADHLKGLTKVHGDVLLPTSTILGGEAKSNGEAKISNLAATAPTDNLEFRIHTVVCRDRTSDGIAGLEASDEMRLGGASADENGDTKTVKDFSVQTFTSDGQQKNYSPPLRFTYFNLNEGTAFPKTYWVTPVLAEQDKGDFWEYLYNLTKSVEKEITAALAAAVGIAIGSSGGPVGAIIGAVVGAAVGAAFTLFKNIVGDEIFGGPALSCSIPSLTARWSGNTYSPQHVVTYNGYGGQYQMTYSWNMYA
ncbi:hypothetical protein GXP67_36370 [Rhodocytophaga rosea]|uniref:Uncharacterized protein n=1 Tax=Rhodocytophaga rosea TaxID=2704465 RepID=A0A6C0GW12_9BACT|nr:hypothetical protein [Rhodocytophaga rosea]QHT71753.1 hypothetical protein GXP67_36370 [Rhodocytophaga rosea]